jgi:hypothetical protein
MDGVGRLPAVETWQGENRLISGLSMTEPSTVLVAARKCPGLPQCTITETDSSPRLVPVFKDVAAASSVPAGDTARTESAQELMDQLTDGIKHGKISSDPDAMVDLAHRTVDAADHELIGAWKRSKPVFDTLEPRLTPALKEMKTVLDEAKTQSGSLSEPEKGQVEQLLGYYGDFIDGTTDMRRGIIADLAKHDAMKPFADRMDKIENDNLLTLTRYDRVLRQVIGPLLNMSFSRGFAYHVYFLHAESEVQPNEDRKKMISGAMSNISEFLKNDEPMFVDPSNPSGPRLKFWLPLNP